MPRNYRVTLSDALSAHDRALSFGGRAGIVDIGLVESAIARPYSGYYWAISKKASALVESVACNHGFIDGNKRTAIYLARLLVTRSGYRLVSLSGAPIYDETYQMVMATVTGQMDFDHRVAWFKGRLR